MRMFMPPGSSKHKLVPVTGKLAQLLRMLFKNPVPLARQLESSPSGEVHLFSPSAVSRLIITNFIPLTARLQGKVTNTTSMGEGNTQTQLKKHKERFHGVENGSRAYRCVCMCFQTQLAATTRPGRKIMLV